MSPRAVKAVNWTALIAAIAAAVTLSAHFMYVGETLASKADAETVADHTAKIMVLEHQASEIEMWRASVGSKLDTLLVRSER